MVPEQAREAEDVRYLWRGDFLNQEVNALHAEAFDHGLIEDDWVAQVERWSLGWVTARDAAGLVGFVNVIWDGLEHAFVLDTAVAIRARRLGIGRQLIMVAERGAAAAGCAWLHVDFEDRLTPFYLESCGFTSTPAGLIRLSPDDGPMSSG